MNEIKNFQPTPTIVSTAIKNQNSVAATKMVKDNSIYKTTNITPITIKNFHQVDETLLRGAKPTQAQLQELKDNGIKTIISFCTNYNPQNSKQKTPPQEADWAKTLGMNFHWLPFQSVKNPKNSYVEKFFRITDDARAKGEKVFIHCRHGADRTGLFSAIYRLRNHNVKLSEVIKELMAYGHDANHNKNIIPFIIDFKENLNPIKKIITDISKMVEQELPKIKKLLRR